MAWWEASAAFNGVIASCYLGICWTILRGLRDTCQLRSNRLALATAAIFFTCAVHHGMHTVGMLLPLIGSDVANGLAMRQAFSAHMTLWDLVGAIVAVYYLTLRRSYDALLTSPQMFEDRVRERASEDLLALAYTDPLTGLPNRTAFTDRIRELGHSTQSRPTLLFLDLDRFKLVNDTLGHESGDQLLQAAAVRLRGALRAKDVLYRLGGDEFTILLEASDDDVLALAARIRRGFEPAFTVAGRGIHVGVSIGVATADQPGDVADLLRRADTAMYAAKSAGRGTARVFQPHVSDQGHLLEVSSDLARGLDEHEIELDFQPIVDLDTRIVVGAEALVRWRHPSRGRLHPDEFLAAAEDTGQLVAIGRWVLRRACLDAASWPTRPGHPAPYVTVNVSAAETASEDFVEAVLMALQDSGLAPARLWLEVTERTAERDTPQLAARLQELRRRGVRVALDDFGTGWASLSRLHDLPVDMIKIDRSFVVGEPDTAEATLAGSVALLARSLHLPSVAEGIESSSQLDRMLALGCHLGQGFLLGRPMPTAQFARDITRPPSIPAPRSSALPAAVTSTA